MATLYWCIVKQYTKLTTKYFVWRQGQERERLLTAYNYEKIFAYRSLCLC